MDLSRFVDTECKLDQCGGDRVRSQSAHNRTALRVGGGLVVATFCGTNELCFLIVNVHATLYPTPRIAGEGGGLRGRVVV